MIDIVRPLTNQELEHLLHFIGYGVLNADAWFLGMEEAGGGEENIRARLKFRTVEDCAEAHRLLGITKHHWGKRQIQRTCGTVPNYLAPLTGLFPGLPGQTFNVRADATFRQEGW